MNIEEAVAVVRNHPDYRLVERFRGLHGFPEYVEDRPAIKTGIYVDTETTGVDVRKDNIIELAYIVFQYDDEKEEIVAIRDRRSYLSDPGRPLDDTIRSLTGITQEDVAGKMLPMNDIAIDFAMSSLIIAHNAGFDRKILERYFPDLAKTVWACSQQDVPWRLEFSALGEKLELLALTCGGVFYEAHRALADCEVGLYLLATATDSEGHTAFAHLLNNSRQDIVRIWATGSPYSAKDLLRENGYRWNDGTDGRPKAWNKVIDPQLIDVEREFLRTKALAYPQITTTESVDKYSVRDR